MPQVAWVGNLIPVLLSQRVHNMHEVSFLISHGLSSSLLQLVPSSTSACPSSSFLSLSPIQISFPSFSEKQEVPACGNLLAVQMSCRYSGWVETV